jgi:hypothetical protein
MSKPMVLEIDVQTQEEVVREMTDLEYENHLKNIVQINEQGQEINPNSVV